MMLIWGLSSGRRKQHTKKEKKKKTRKKKVLEQKHKSLKVLNNGQLKILAVHQAVSFLFITRRPGLSESAASTQGPTKTRFLPKARSCRAGMKNDPDKCKLVFLFKREIFILMEDRVKTQIISTGQKFKQSNQERKAHVFFIFSSRWRTFRRYLGSVLASQEGILPAAKLQVSRNVHQAM